eukprot:superscaffoldBa00001666_g11545
MKASLFQLSAVLVAEAMFSKATANFVRQIDPEGSLIHVSRLNDSQKLDPMALVVKRNRIWFWQRPKYQPTDFTLSDLLQGDEVLTPGVSGAEFLSYNGTYGDQLHGKLEAEAGPASVALEGRGAVKLQSCFGKLRKEELDVKKLLRDSSGRLVDMQHVLVQQLEKRAEVLAVVKERILTTSTCTVSQTKKEDCTFQGLMGMLGSRVKVCVKDSNNIEVDSDVSLEIPSGSEEMDLSALAEFPQSTRRALFLKLQETLRDNVALTYLQSYLEEELYTDETLNMEKQEEELSESQRKLMSAILDSIGTGGHTENGQSGGAARMNAAHLLVSAMEELPDKTLSLLSESRPDFLEAFDTLMCLLKEGRQPLPIQSLPVQLQDNQTFQLAEQLLSSINVTLRRDTDWLRAETEDEQGVLTSLLCLSVHGLFLLCSGQN